MVLLFTRHCKTEANINNYWSGLSDIDITDEGKKSIPSLCEEAKKYKIDAIYCSPLKRAIETAKPIADIFDLSIKIDPLLIERNFANLENKPCDSQVKNDLSNWQLNIDLDQGVEKIQDMYYNRIKVFFDKLIKEHKGETVLVVAHSWIYRLLLFYLSKEKNSELIYQTPKSAHIYEFKIND